MIVEIPHLFGVVKIDLRKDSVIFAAHFGSSKTRYTGEVMAIGEVVDRCEIGDEISIDGAWVSELGQLRIGPNDGYGRQLCLCYGFNIISAHKLVD